MQHQALGTGRYHVTFGGVDVISPERPNLMWSVREFHRQQDLGMH